MLNLFELNKSSGPVHSEIGDKPLALLGDNPLQSTIISTNLSRRREPRLGSVCSIS